MDYRMKAEQPTFEVDGARTTKPRRLLVDPRATIKNTKIQVQIIVPRTFAVRRWIGQWLIRLGGRVIGFGASEIVHLPISKKE